MLNNPSIWFHFTYCRLGAKHDFYSGGGFKFHRKPAAKSVFLNSPSGHVRKPRTV